MRLVCPNCGAQYEVDDRVIPDSGRDVQCSSCGHGWYQMPAGIDAVEAAAPEEPEDDFGPDEGLDESLDESLDDDGDEDTGALDVEPVGADDIAAPPVSEPTPEPGPDADAALTGLDQEPAEADLVPESEPEPEDTATESAADSVFAEPVGLADDVAVDDKDGGDEDDEDDVTGPAPGVEGMAAPKRDLDQNLRAILQEEVAREMAAREADTGPTVIETAPLVETTEAPEERDPALDLIIEPSKPMDDDLLADADLDDDRVDVFAAPPGLDPDVDKPRKDLFPDIEEINSTLDSHGPGGGYEEEDEAEESSGFARAFLVVIGIAALLLALYLVAPRLAASVPALEPVLSAYVGAINGIRAVFTNLL